MFKQQSTTRSFLVKLDGSIDTHTGSYPIISGGVGTCGSSKTYGLFSLIQADSFRKLKSDTINNTEISFIMDNKYTINKPASIITTKLDANYNHIIVGYCYFIFESGLIELDEFKNLIKY